MKNVSLQGLWCIILLSISSLLGSTIVIPVQESKFQRDTNLKIVVCEFSLELKQHLSGYDSIILGLDQKLQLLDSVDTLSTRRSYKAIAPGGEAYTVFFTDLPLVSIVMANDLSDEKQAATFSLVDTSHVAIQSYVGIELRGGSSKSWPKKKFDIEFWIDSAGIYSWEVPLLGMRSDKDWIFEAMYNEPLRVRSFTNWQIWKNTHILHYAGQEPGAKSYVSGRYVEMFINGSYKGVYALTEKIDRKQLRLKKTSEGHIRGQLYKSNDWTDATMFKGSPEYDNLSDIWSGFEHKYPDNKDTIQWTDLHAFIDFVANSEDTLFDQEIAKQCDLNNIADYYIFLNLLTGYDNSGKNLFIARYDTASPYFIVPWDLDGTWGIFWDGVQHNYVDAIMTNPFFDRLLAHDSLRFKALLKKKWDRLRDSVYANERLIAMFKDNLDRLEANNIYEREQLAWPDYTKDSLEFSRLETYMYQRLGFLDHYFSFPGEIITGVDDASAAIESQVYPNPARTQVTVFTKHTQGSFVYIYSTEGLPLGQWQYQGGTKLTLNLDFLKEGMYVIKVGSEMHKLLIIR